jgi:hypothetical protein
MQMQRLHELIIIERQNKITDGKEMYGIVYKIKFTFFVAYLNYVENWKYKSNCPTN